MSGAVVALRSAMTETVHPQGTYALERNITIISEVGLQIPGKGCDPSKEGLNFLH